MQRRPVYYNAPELSCVSWGWGHDRFLFSVVKKTSWYGFSHYNNNIMHNQIGLPIHG